MSKITVSKLPFEVFYDSSSHYYYVQDRHGIWMTIDKADMRLRLKRAKFSTKLIQGLDYSKNDEVLMDIQEERHVHYAGPLAGYSSGVHLVNGIKLLVTQSPTVMQPKEGTWPLHQQLIDGQMAPCCEDSIDQAAYWHSYVKLSRQALRACMATGQSTYGQAIILVGPKGCGKSLLQKLFTHMLGGRVAMPFPFMSGVTPFNRDLFFAEHLMIEDEQPLKTPKDRVRFGAAIKGVTARIDHACHGKNRDGLSLTPFWRLSISVNNDRNHLEVLPLFDESMMDKCILVHCRKMPMPMPAGTPEEKAAFEAALLAEMPAYLHWIDNVFEIPDAIRDPDRYGVKAFFHPSVMTMLEDFSPQLRLLSLIDHSLFEKANPGDSPLCLTAEQLIHALNSHHVYGDQAKAFRLASSYCGRLLMELAKTHGNRVEESRSKDQRLWMIHPPAARVLPLPASLTPHPTTTDTLDFDVSKLVLS